MIPFRNLLYVLFGLNLFGSFVFFLSSIQHQSSLTDLQLSSTQDLYTQSLDLQALQDLTPEDFATPISNQKVATTPQTFKTEPLVDPSSPQQSFTRQTNPFYKLGVYPEVKIPVPYEGKYEQVLPQVNYGIANEDDYCELVDYHNLANPQNIFENRNFFSDFPDDTIVRRDVIRQIGKDTKPEINKYTSATESHYTLDVAINTFYMDAEGFYRYHQIGKNFLCATQMYNQIPGSRALVRKNDLIESFNRWVEKHSPRPFCFNDKTYFPKSYRLSKQEECDSFFNRIKSKRYQKSLGSEPIQYIIKSGHESLSGDGVHILDKETTSWLMTEFHSGTKCGRIDTELIAQEYISNPLLLNMNNKFDFRVYMLVASTNPLIVYSHDGYLRASLSSYDKFSTDPEKHLTSNHVAQDTFMKAREESTYNGKTEGELREAHILRFEELQKYLLETGKITDENWLESYLRPQFSKVMIHLVKMTSHYYLKQSNVYGLYGLDFMLDDELGLWFMELEPNPQMTSTNPIIEEVLNKMLQSLFEIEYGLYRSRMKRAFTLLKSLRSDEAAGYPVRYSDWRREFVEDNKNRFEPEFRMSQNNSFSLVMDESLPGADAYRGYIDILCVFAH